MLSREGAASRIRERRESLGLGPADIVERTGLTLSEVLDLESYDDEVQSVVSAGALVALFSVLGLPPGEVLAAPAPRGVPVQSFVELGAFIQDYVMKRGIRVEEFEESIGWDIKPALSNPSQFEEMTVDALAAISAAIGADWLGLLEARVRETRF